MIIKAPNVYPTDGLRIFLAGSIEMGAAELWQDRVAHKLDRSDLRILNPRRDNWDSSWAQSIDNPQFYEQVTWELEGLEGAELVLFYFDPNTKSPITLLELGLCKNQRSIVCCPMGFWRRGNVEVVCHRYGIPLVAEIDDFIAKAREELDVLRAYHLHW